MRGFQDKVVYQIYPKSFCDSGGDGVGDLKGVTSKLDYIRDLGADYIWLTPFFPSPQRDNGYDVQDYCAVDPLFGTMADAEELLREAEKRGIGLMLDMVFNHTSTAHRWFQRALAGEKEYQDYYIFREGTPDAPPTNWQSKFGGSAWEWVPSLGKWYLHLFDVTQADLNWENPAVREELKNVIRFWQGKGVRAFRFDVVNLISKPDLLENDETGDGRRFYTDGPRVHEYIRELVRDTGLGDAVTVGEMSSTSLSHCLRYTQPQNGELAMTFSFHHLKVDYLDGDKWRLQPPDLGRLRELLETWQTGMAQGDGWNALFWCNHDQPRVVSRFGDDEKYWKESAKMLALCLHLMRGTPYVYQGEELGMTNAYFDRIEQYRDVESVNYFHILRDAGLSETDVTARLQARSRDNSRTPMQWDGTAQAGFTAGTPWIGVPARKPEANAAAEEKDPASILHFYRRLIRLRKELPIVAQGDIRFLFQEQPGIIAYERTLENKKLTVICNFTAEEKPLPGTGSLSETEALLDSYEDAPHFENGALCLRPWEGCAFLQ